MTRIILKDGKYVVMAPKKLRVLERVITYFLNYKKPVKIMVTDKELESSFEYWLAHYQCNGDSHYSDDKIERIQEIYYDKIVDRVLQDLPEMTDEENDVIVERLSNMF